MKFVLSALLVAAMSVLSAGSVLAQEDFEFEPVYTQPVQLLPFAGAYIGATAGWVRVNADQTAFPIGGPGAPTVPPIGVSSEGDGPTVGLHTGYSWQFGGAVVGFETDLSWMDVDASRTLPPPPLGGSETFRTSYDYWGSVRGRLGWAFQNWLLYGTGGYAYAKVEHSLNAPLLPSPLRQSNSDLLDGWTAGGGIEVATFNSLGPVTLRAEALYVDLNDTTITYTKPGCAVCTTRVKWEDDFVVVRVGFSVPLLPSPVVPVN